jgi:hypothetical protein
MAPHAAGFAGPPGFLFTRVAFSESSGARTLMTTEERKTLETAILTICDPRGNWAYGWALLCQLVGLDPEIHPAPFRPRSDEDLRQVGRAIGALKMPPRNPN